METNQTFTCSQCRHFHQHYGKGVHGEFIEIYAGHCGTPRLRNRKPDAAACQNFAPLPAEPPQD